MLKGVAVQPQIFSGHGPLDQSFILSRIFKCVWKVANPVYMGFVGIAVDHVLLGYHVEGTAGVCGVWPGVPQHPVTVQLL